MEQKLQECINYLTIAKEAVAKDNADPDTALENLEKSQVILDEFMQIDDSEKQKYKEQLIQIQALGQFINQFLAKNKAELQSKVLHSTRMSSAVKGYAKN